MNFTKESPEFSFFGDLYKLVNLLTENKEKQNTLTTWLDYNMDYNRLIHGIKNEKDIKKVFTNYYMFVDKLYSVTNGYTDFSDETCEIFMELTNSFHDSQSESELLDYLLLLLLDFFEEQYKLKEVKFHQEVLKC